MSSEPVRDAVCAARAADDLRSVPGRRRTGLVFGWGAVACAAGALLTWFVDRDGPRPVTVVLLLACIVAALVAAAFLRRAWSVPEVADMPAAVRARGWCDAAVVAWGSSLLVRFVFGQLFDLGGTWLDVVRGVLGTVAVVAYVGMLVLATRWRPAPAVQL